jgi:hypothetical protein
MVRIGLMCLRQRRRVIKLPQLLDFVRLASPCRIFALLQINHHAGLSILALRQSYWLERGHVRAILWVCGNSYCWLGASRVRF